MPTRKDASEVSSDRRKWRKVFNALVEMLGKQQAQLMTLVKERKLLEGRIQMQHRRWNSDVRFLKDRISQMKGALKVQDMAHFLESTKLDFALGLKQREALLYKLKLDQADDELADFRGCLDIIPQKCSEFEESAQLNNSAETRKTRRGLRSSDRKPAKDAKEVQEEHTHLLEEEMKKLRLEYDKLVSEKNSETSALLAEKKFVWHQYNILETNFNDKLKSKGAELELANQKISKLLTSMEKLEMMIGEKDDTIAELKSKIDEMETILGKRNEEIARLAHESEALKKSTVTPVLSHCTSRTRTSKTEGKNSVAHKRTVLAKKETGHPQVSDSLKDSEKGTGRSKRKAVAVETPKLFSSSFKVPKLKASAVR
ncbi:desmoplakin [Rhodamnia argentea]|uniref:Desmoplakin n=1 Tax=Rhodamnia argentea TaxID=178133 RepID=A0A8B8Q325_9MYRT|nr:desmoplakin [Rhodamnia argentea]